MTRQVDLNHHRHSCLPSAKLLQVATKVIQVALTRNRSNIWSGIVHPITEVRKLRAVLPTTCRRRAPTNGSVEMNSEWLGGKLLGLVGGWSHNRNPVSFQIRKSNIILQTIIRYLYHIYILYIHIYMHFMHDMDIYTYTPRFCLYVLADPKSKNRSTFTNMECLYRHWQLKISPESQQPPFSKIYGSQKNSPRKVGELKKKHGCQYHFF